MRKLLIGLTLTLGAALIAALLGLTPFARTVEMKTYDFRVRATAAPESARRDIVMVVIDEDSIHKMEPLVGRWPWPRLVHAQLVNYLTRGPAKVIAYDVLFSERDRMSFKVQDDTWTGEESDQALVEAVAKAGNVVLGADATREEAVDSKAAPEQSFSSLRGADYHLDGPLEQRPIITPPFDELARAARALGHTYFAFDADGPVRRSVPFIRVRGRAIPSLATAAAITAAGIPPARVRLDGSALVLGDARMPLIDARSGTLGGSERTGRRSLVRFMGPVQSSNGKPTYAEYSFYRLFYSEEQILAGQRPLVDPAVFRNKVVIVGVVAAGLHDVFGVPFTEGKMPGMEVHATVVDNILSGRFMGPAPWWAAALTLVVASAIVAFVCVFFGAWWTVAAAALVLGAVTGVATAVFARGGYLPMVPPVLATLAAAFGGVGYQYLVEGREKRKVKRVFSRMVAPDVYNHLLADPSRTRLGGERREMTVLFSDIRGFTTFTEKGRAEDIVAQLNEYFTAIVDALFRHRGTVDKFVGDMVMALFGAPVDDPDHAEHAIEAALDMVATLQRLNARWALEGRPRLASGIGINTGGMIAGNVGSERIMSYTVIGDAVNLGSRLESLNKQYGTTIIISESTLQRLKGRYDVQALGEVTVKGKSQAVTIYAVHPESTIDNTSEDGRGPASPAGEVT